MPSSLNWLDVPPLWYVPAMAIDRRTRRVCSLAALTFGLTAAAGLGVHAQAPAGIAPDRTALNFAIRGEAGTPAQVVHLEHVTPGTPVDWTAVSTVPWLTLTPAGGRTPARLTVALGAAPSGPARTETGTVRIALAGAPAPITITVTLSVAPGPGTPPFGSFDAPADRTSITAPITLQGWALDDVFVEGVDIVTGPSRRVVAHAVFADGGRPDVEAAAPTAPFHTRGSWGAVIDPATLPRPHGTLKFTAVARDREGQSADVGSRLLTVMPASRAPLPPEWQFMLVAAVGLGLVLAVARTRLPAPVPVVDATGAARESWWESAAVCVIIGGFLALHIPWMMRSLDYDELYTASRFVVDVPLSTPLTTVGVFNNHALYSLLAWCSVAVLGSAEWVVRLPALVLGAGAVVATWRLSRRLMAPAAAVAAAALLAASPFFGEWSRSARGYTGLAAMATCSLLFFIRLIHSGRPRDAVAHAVTSALAIYFHLYGVWILAVQGGLVVWRAFGRRPGDHQREPGWRTASVSVVAAGALALLMYAPVVSGLAQVFAARGHGTFSGGFGLALGRAIAGAESGWMVALAAVLAAAGVVSLARRHPVAVSAAVGALVAPLLLMWVWLRPLDLQPRFFVYWMPLFAVLAAASAWRAWRWRPAAGLAVAAMIAWMAFGWVQLNMSPAPTGGGYRAMLAGTGSGPVYIVGADAEMFRYYLGPITPLHSVSALDRALADTPTLRVAYHAVPWNTPDLRAIADRLARRCAVDDRGRVVMFQCRD